jgi:hypothetical protein
MWPGAEPPALLVAGFDQIAVANENVLVIARIERLEGEKGDADLSNRNLTFGELLTGLQTEAKTASDGQAVAEARFPAAEQPFQVILSYKADARQRRGVHRALARVYAWPADASILVVDLDAALFDIEQAAVGKTNNMHPGALAAAALRATSAKYHIAYLAAEAKGVLHYNKLRTALERESTQPREPLPPGPLLSRECYPSGKSISSFHQIVLSDLQQRFHGRIACVVKRVEEAQALPKAGVSVFLLGDRGAAQDGIVAAGTWKELATLLLK